MQENLENKLRSSLSGMKYEKYNVSELLDSISFSDNEVGLIFSTDFEKDKFFKFREEIESNLSKEFPDNIFLIVGTNKTTSSAKSSSDKKNSPPDLRPKPPTPKSIAGVKKIIAVASGKGGVGKSTIASHLALSLSQQGHKVGIVDADIYGPSLARIFGLLDKKDPKFKDSKIEPYELGDNGLKINSIAFLLPDDSAAIWRGPMVGKALHQLIIGTNWGEIDYLILDLPPGTGDVHLSLSQNYKIDEAILVTTPQQVALEDVKKAKYMFDKVGIEISGMVLNMAYFEDDSGQKNYIFGDAKEVKNFATRNDIQIIAEIPVSESISKSCDEGLDFTNNVLLKYLDLDLSNL